MKDIHSYVLPVSRFAALNAVGERLSGETTNEVRTDAPSANNPDSVQFSQAREDGITEGREVGYKEGFEAGRTAGLESAETLVANAITEQTELLMKLIESVKHQRTEVFLQNQEDLLETCFEVVCSLIGEKIIDRSKVREVIGHSLAQSEAAPVEIRLNPADLDYLQQSPEGLPRIAHKDGLQESPLWVSDSEVGRGGCIWRTANGTIDARLEVKLAKVMRLLLSVNEVQK